MADVDRARVKGSWARDPNLYLAGSSEIAEVDMVALAMERTWGADRLRLLPGIGPELRAKFDAQRIRFNAAIYDGSLETVKVESRRMINAWRALDKAATAHGDDKLPVVVWEFEHDGKVVALVRDDECLGCVRPEGRAMIVITLAEIKNLLDHYAKVCDVKASFPGARVTGISLPADPVGWGGRIVEDDIPF